MSSLVGSVVGILFHNITFIKRFLKIRFLIFIFCVADTDCYTRIIFIEWAILIIFCKPKHPFHFLVLFLHTDVLSKLQLRLQVGEHYIESFRKML